MKRIIKLLRQFSKKEYRKYGIGLSLLILVLLALIVNKAIFFILAFLLVNIVVGFLLIPLKTFLFSISLALLAAVTCGMAYGPKVGFFTGILVTIPKIIMQQNIGPYSIPPVLSYGLVGVIGGLLAGMGVEGVFVAGMIATIFHNVFSAIMIAFMGGGWGKNLIFWLTNIPFNAVMFYFIAPYLLKVML